jgi:hypothetical protein
VLNSAQLELTQAPQCVQDLGLFLKFHQGPQLVIVYCQFLCRMIRPSASRMSRGREAKSFRTMRSSAEQVRIVKPGANAKSERWPQRALRKGVRPARHRRRLLRRSPPGRIRFKEGLSVIVFPSEAGERVMSTSRVTRGWPAVVQRVRRSGKTANLGAHRR